MTRDEIRGLMGGYATGSLSDAERKILFDAALEDQELFDDLAREQALKEVLDEPGAKQRLIAVLARQTPEPNRGSWWRAPWIWAAAGAAALALLVGLALLQTGPKRSSEQAVARLETPVSPVTPAAPAITPPTATSRAEAIPAPKPAASQVLRDEPATPPREIAQPAPRLRAFATEEPALSKSENAAAPAPAPPAPTPVAAAPPPPPAPKAEGRPPTTVGGLTPVPPATAERVTIAPEQVPVIPAPQLAESFVVNGSTSSTGVPPPAAGAPAAAGAVGGGRGGGGGGGRGGRGGGGAGANKTTAPQPAADALAETRIANTPLGFAGARALSAPRFAFDYSVSAQGSLRIVPAASGFLTVGVSNGTTTSVIFSNRAVQTGVATETPLPADAVSAAVLFSAQAAAANALSFVKNPMDPPSGTMSDPNPSPNSRLSAVFPVKR